MAVEDTKLQYARHMTRMGGNTWIYSVVEGNYLEKSTSGWKPEKETGGQQKDRN